MNRKLYALIIVVFINIFLISGCEVITERLKQGNEIASEVPAVVEKSPNLEITSEFDGEAPQVDEEAAVEMTVNAMLTEAADLFTDTPIPPTETLVPTNTLPAEMKTELAASLTALVETATPTATFTVVPTNTEVVTPTSTSVPCLAARFVADVNVPDGSIIQPGEVFYKTWQVQNVGSCNWESNFSIVYKSGFQLGGVSPTNLGVRILSGQYVTLSIQFVAPLQGGSYISDWWLQDNLGNTFGVGPNYDQSFYLQILVPGGNGDTFVNPASTSPPFSTSNP